MLPLRSLALLLSCSALSACGGSGPPPPPAPTPAQQQAAQAAAQAAEKLKMYEQLRAAGKNDLAAEIGSDITTRFAGTPAAQEVAKTLPELQKQAREAGETRRLQRLWSYQESPAGKGKQYHVSIYAKGGPTAESPQRVTLFIRQHPEWGQSTYLMRDESGFRCPADCTLTLRFDGGKPERWAGTIPPTGEPAIFIDKNEALIARLLKSKTLSIDTDWKDQGKRTLEFEVGGLDPARLPPAGKKK
ncbi:hypothetical protein [Tahibacter harae]|uniref:Lipoprotein n=1 Tax=Tahibacter harae TaxID=2963937 RepID=A0ABT1QXA9_9GAMM|nr:hypothetical protein [Tahibacter harae]MCQ4166927.1 hypothetical protein [Tahibacter harae]